jgi:hypothetical protein
VRCHSSRGAHRYLYRCAMSRTAWPQRDRADGALFSGSALIEQVQRGDAATGRGPIGRACASGIVHPLPTWHLHTLSGIGWQRNRALPARSGRHDGPAYPPAVSFWLWPCRSAPKFDRYSYSPPALMGARGPSKPLTSSRTAVSYDKQPAPRRCGAARYRKQSEPTPSRP